MAASSRLRPLAFWSFIVLMAGLTALFATLGFWQLDRLAEKEAQIAAVEARGGGDPVDFPEPALWTGVDAEAVDYTPMRVSGRYDHSRTVLVFDNLSRGQGRYGGAGYWVMAPLILATGEAVWINRGFVPQDRADDFALGGGGPEGEIELSGLARRPERPNPFTPAPDLETGREWIRDPARLSAIAGLDRPAAPLYIDLPAGAPGELPQGGETEVTFSNRHLEYAGTWFAFALITPLMLLYWLYRQRRHPLAPPPSSD